MARSKRPAFEVPEIEPRGVRAVLRPPEEIAAEGERLQQRESAAPAARRATTARTNGRTDERSVVRHSFDIYIDQLQALTRIQTQVFEETGRKPKMGELAQEAFDLYIASKAERANE